MKFYIFLIAECLEDKEISDQLKSIIEELRRNPVEYLMVKPPGTKINHLAEKRLTINNLQLKLGLNGFNTNSNKERMTSFSNDFKPSDNRDNGIFLVNSYL